MRSLILSGAVALLVACVALADEPTTPARSARKAPDTRPRTEARAEEPNPLDLPTEVQRLRDQWIRCSAAAAKGAVRGDRPADEVAAEALRQCRAQEDALARALRRQLGTESAGRVLDLVRETDRTNLVRAIQEIRAGR